VIPRSLRARLLAAFLVVVVAALGIVGIAVLLTSSRPGPSVSIASMRRGAGRPAATGSGSPSCVRWRMP
jgi:hypothetical protein